MSNARISTSSIALSPANPASGKFVAAKNENFPDMSGGGGMGCRVPPADTSETEERDEDNIVHPPLNWSDKRKGGVDKMKSIDVLGDKRLPVSALKKGVSK